MKTINYDWHNVDKAIQSIAMQMYESEWRPDYIVGITRGGLVPAVILSHMTNIPMHTLCVQLAAEGLEENTESNIKMAGDAINNKNILITAHTGSGKTLPAEYAIQKVLSKNFCLLSVDKALI